MTDLLFFVNFSRFLLVGFAFRSILAVKNVHCTKNEVFFSKCYQISRELRIRSYLLKKFLMENCAVTEAYFVPQSNINAVLYFRKNCP